MTDDEAKRMAATLGQPPGVSVTKFPLTPGQQRTEAANAKDPLERIAYALESLAGKKRDDEAPRFRGADLAGAVLGLSEREKDWSCPYCREQHTLLVSRGPYVFGCVACLGKLLADAVKS